MNKSRLFCARTAGRQWMRYFLMLACLLLLIAGRAQTYPVQVTTTLIPPYSPVLSYYTAADANNLQVIIHVMELDRTDLRAKLRVTIEGAGVRLYTSPAYVPPALVLQGGVPEMLSGFDIRGYLNPNNLIFEGITRAEFIKSGKLPEGFYTFTIEVLEYNRSVRISNQSRANAWVVLNDPPLINFPFSGDKLRTTDPQNISFSWVGRHLASPNSAFSTEYEFTLFELYPGQTNPEVAVRSSNSIYRTTTAQSSLYYGPAEPQLIPGKKYAYRIRAYDVSGRDLFKNQGYSETNWFQYGDACLPLRSVTAEALDPSRIRISWEPEATHTGFVVSYREAGTDTWWKETTFTTSLVIPDLKRGTAYEYQVMGQCNQYEGETSTIQTISTEEEETEDPNFACGTDLIMPELSPNPLQKPLLPLDLFHIGGLDVVVHSVTLNADGSYSGMGHAPMPIFNGAGMRVKIRSVIINEDYYAIAGSVVTVYDTEGRFIVGNTDDLKGDLSEEDAPEDTTTNDIPDDNLLAVEGDIGSVEVIDGELVVTDVDGNPIDIGTVELPAEGETLTLEDASGDTWVVDAEGNVTPGTGNGGTDPNTPGAVGSEVELDYVVTFSPSENQTYGFDEKTQPNLGGYNQTQLNGENHWVAWKSIESGRTDQVQVSVADQDEFPDYIGFKTPTGTIPSQTGKDKHTRELTLSGLMAGNPTTLTAFATQKDEAGNATEVTLGRLDVVAYDMERQKVVIVPVNDAQTPDANVLYESLNKIYAQAVAQWEVVVDHSYSVEPEVLQTLDEGESGLFASFPKNMKQFQKDFKKSRDTDKDAYYLFLIPGSGARAGFMPFKRQYGYIWTGATSDLPRTIAHELAHGAFRLRHTFSPEAFIATQGSTDNLMDYLSTGAGSSAGATHLYKHQWDNVHNPEGVTSWLQDDEEGAMEGEGMHDRISRKLKEFGDQLDGQFYAIKHCEDCSNNTSTTSRTYEDLTIPAPESAISIQGQSYRIHSGESAKAGNASCVILYVTTSDDDVAINANIFQSGFEQPIDPVLMILDGNNQQFVCTNGLGAWSQVICQDRFDLTEGYIDDLLGHLNECIQGPVVAHTAIPASEQDNLIQLVEDFKAKTGISTQVTVVDQADFDQTVNSAKMDEDVHLIIGKDGETYQYKFLYRDGLFEKPTSKILENGGGTIVLDYEWNEVETIRDRNIDLSISTQAAIGKLAKRQEPMLNIFERGMWVVKTTKDVLAEIKVPKPLWNEDPNNPYPFSLEAFTSGLADGAIDELKSVPDLLVLGLSMFDTEQFNQLITAISSIDLEAIGSMFSDKGEKYSGGGVVAWHEGGYDVVQIASMFYGGALIKGGKKAKETADSFLKILDDVPESVKDKLNSFTKEQRDALLKDLGESPELLTRIDGELVNSWESISSAAKKANPGIADAGKILRKDIKSLEAFAKFDADLIGKIGQQRFDDFTTSLIKANPKCKTCGNAGDRLVGNLDEIMDDLHEVVTKRVDFSDADLAKGFDDFLKEAGEQASKAKGSALTLKKMARNWDELTEGGWSLKGFEGNIPDIETGHRLDLLLKKVDGGRELEKSIEMKNWSAPRSISGSAYDQFKAYISSGKQFDYYFSDGLSNTMKGNFQNVFKDASKANELWDANPSFFQGLSNDITSVDDLIDLANDGDLADLINWVN